MRTLGAALFIVFVSVANAQPGSHAYPYDVPFQVTPQELIDAMMDLAHVGKGDILYDLGSGDGRIPISAAKERGARAVGIEIDPQLVRKARDNARREGVSDLVEFRQEDIFKADFSEATVVTMYLLPEVNLKLRPRLLRELKPGTRIVSHRFDMGDWKPDKTVEVHGRVLYLWTIPEHVK